MATTKQRVAAKANIKKAQRKWRSMSARAHSLVQPEGRGRKRPGAGGGRFYRIEVRPKSEFVTFRTQDVGEKGGLERIAGKRRSGSWDTATWLIEKKAAHVNSKEQLVIDDPRAKTALKQIRGPIVHKKGDVFSAHPRKNVPEKSKPTLAERRARNANIKKAQAARRKKSRGRARESIYL
jgi:plasmid stabilization system protein ParE